MIGRLNKAKALPPTASLAVGGSNSPSTALLPSLLARFEKRHPQIQINLRTDTSAAVERIVVKGDVDLALITNPPANQQLNMEPYRSEPLVAFIASNHPLAKRKQIESRNLSRFGLIIRSQRARKGASQEYIRRLRANGFKPNVIMHCDTPVAVKEAVREKVGVGILYRDVVANNITRGEFKIVKMPGHKVEGKSFIVYHKNRPLSPLAQEFLKLLRSQKPRRGTPAATRI